ncbi:hypothetical protein JCM11251_006027 [Rhodosporidiobolus azoricus]
MEWSHLEQGLAHADNDRRIHALGLLKQELETSAQLADLEHLAAVLRSSVKSNNAHVSNAALACLPPFFTSIVPESPTTVSSPSSAAHTLKHSVQLLLPLDKLGDAKVQTRTAARMGVVAAAHACLRLGGESGVGAAKDREGAWQVVESGMVEYAFKSKNAKAREQALLYLEALRAPPTDSSSTPLPALRPYTPLLIPLLSDSDSHVRSLALQTTIHIFTHHSVSAPAKADLKKEMLKMEVAKKVQDQILAAVLGGATPGGSLERSPSQASLSSAGGKSDGASSRGIGGPRSASSSHPPPPIAVVASADGPARRTRSQAAASSSTAAHTPSLLASLPSTAFPSDPSASTTPSSSEISPVYLASERDLRSSFEGMKSCFEGKETEHNWQTRDRSVATIRGMILGGVCEGELRESFVRAVKEVAEGVAKVSASLRTTLALSTLSLISELFSALPSSSPQIDLLLDPFLPHLLSMSGQTKKIVASASQSTLTVLLERSGYHARTLQLVAALLNEKTVSARQFAIQHLNTLLRTHAARSRAQLDSSGGTDELEAAVKKALIDPNAGVREGARTAFWVFEGVWPSRAEKVMAALDAGGKKLLEKARPAAGAAAVASSSSPAPAAAAVNGTRRAPPTRSPAAAEGTMNGSGAKKPSVRELMMAARRKKQEQEANGEGIHDELLPEDPMPAEAPAAGPSTPIQAGGTASPSDAKRTASTAKSGLLSPPPAPSPARSPLMSSSRPLASDNEDAGSVEEEEPNPEAQDPRHQDDLMHSPSPFRLRSPLPSATSPSRSPLRTPSRLPNPASASRPIPQNLTQTPIRSIPSQSSLASSSSASFTPDFSRSPRSRPRGMGTGSLIPDPVVDDALREQAMQAEQAAERLLELAEDEAAETSASVRTETPKPVRVAPPPSATGSAALMQTPLMNPARRSLTVLGGGKTFEDSPDPKDGLGGGKGTWWMRKGESLPPPPSFAPDSPTRAAEISALIASLQSLYIDAPSLRKLSALSKERPVRDIEEDDAEETEPVTPSKTNGSSAPGGAALDGKTTTAKFWTEERRFEKVYEGLKGFLLQQAEAEPTTTRGIALLLLKDLVENQFPCLAGEEAGLFDLLFKLREDPSRTSIAATESISTLFTSRLEPLYGLGCLNRALTTYLSSAQAAPDAIARSFALGLKLMGSLYEALPGEVLEDVLPGSQVLIKQALNDPASGDLRRAAITALVSAQSVLRDEQRLTELIGGLERDQANLLSYYCAKRGV